MKKFDSEQERKDYFRAKQAERRKKQRGGESSVKPRVKNLSGSVATATLPAQPLSDVPLSVYSDGEIMTVTDRLFESKHPGYYIFDTVEREPMCMTCFKKFRTRLMLLRFCSPSCQHKKLESFSTVGVTI